MKRNFKLIWGFGIAEKELHQRYKKWTVQDGQIHPAIKQIIDRFLNLGINEFFVGYNPPYWHQEFGFEFSPNGRFGENEQITSYETLKQAVDYIHQKNAQVFLAVNFRYYSDVTMPYIQKIIDDALKAWVDGLIVSTPEVLEYLKEIGYQGKITFSTIWTIYNAEHIEFILEELQDAPFKLNRVILPRELTPAEIKNLAEQFPKVDFEIFGHWDYCRYANGLCLAEHKYFSRDICWFVIKHWLEVKKTIRPDFKKIVLNPELDDATKQEMLDNQIKDIKEIFVQHNIFGTSKGNLLLDQYLTMFAHWEVEDAPQIAKSIAQALKRELKLNFHKYIRDGLRPPTDLHNLYIQKVLSLWDYIKPYLEKQKAEEIQKQIDKVKKIKQKAEQYFENQKITQGPFGMEKLYKFMLYNRTSVPFYHFFNQIPNVKVIKIPLRGRDISVLLLGLEMIDDAIQNPQKYIDEGNISGKYFHYDPTILEVYQDKLNELEK